jgi:hypothetical protein
MRDRIGRFVLTFAIAATPGFQVTADWVADHITNPEWPPHAKYHLIVYHLTLVLCSAAAVAACWMWRPNRLPITLATGAVFVFWIPYYVAALFPQASPYASAALAARGFPAQFAVGGVLMLAAVIGRVLIGPAPAGTDARSGH